MTFPREKDERSKIGAMERKEEKSHRGWERMKRTKMDGEGKMRAREEGEERKRAMENRKGGGEPERRGKKGRRP